MFNRWYPLGNDSTVVASGSESDRIVDFYNSRNTKVCIYANWGSTVSLVTGGQVTLLPGMGPGDDPTDPKIKFATNDPSVGIVTQPLAAPILNPVTSEYESVTIFTMKSSEMSRFVKLLIENLDGTYPMTLSVGRESSQ
jgi:hypothetical protein